MINSVKKEYKSIDEQIEILKSRNLKFLNSKCINRMKWYLENYGYQNIINGYNDFFLIEKNRKLNKFSNESNSDMIIELFNWDRNIAGNILQHILNVERKITNIIFDEISKYCINILVVIMNVVLWLNMV